jgi:hypothetical protein
VKRPVLLLKLRVAQRHGEIELALGNRLRGVLGVLHRLHQRLAHNLVFDNGNVARLALGRRLEHRLDGLDALKRRNEAVVRDGRAAALRVARVGRARLDAEVLGEKRLDHLGRDVVALRVVGALGDNHNRLALAELAVLEGGERVG